MVDKSALYYLKLTSVGKELIKQVKVLQNSPALKLLSGCAKKRQNTERGVLRPQSSMQFMSPKVTKRNINNELMVCNNSDKTLMCGKKHKV